MVKSASLNNPGILLGAVVFLSGACTMCLELMGSRVLAPYLGTSTFVWTSLIGMVLAALSLGYWWGGLLADRNPDRRALSFILFSASLWIAASAFLSEHLLVALQTLALDLRISSVLAAGLLFGVPSVLLGMVLPYSVRLCTTKADCSGRTVGNLFAVSTTGSIVGTFLTGYVLIAYFNNSTMLCFISLALLAASAIVSVSLRGTAVKTVFFALILWGSSAPGFCAVIPPGKNFVDLNTRYNHVRVYDIMNVSAPYRIMQINESEHSAMFLGKQDLVFAYTEFFYLGCHFKPDFSHSLMIGGGGYSFPKEYLRQYPRAAMDVVEIDPGVTALANRYFGLKQDARLHIFHEDARTFLNHSRKKYDIIFGDAFQSFNVPFQLVTREAARKMSDTLSDDGVVVLNLITAVEGKKGRLGRAVAATFRSVFPQVFLYPVQLPEDGTKVQNVMLVALKSREKPKFYSRDGRLNKYLYNIWMKELTDDMPLLTDDYAPVDHYLLDILPDLQNTKKK